MNTSFGWLARSAFTISLVASIVLGAAGASIEVLDGSVSFPSQFNLTSLIVAVASACGLACSMLALRGARVLPSAGIVLALVAAALEIVLVWTDDSSHEFRQVTACVSICAFACGHAAALRLARLSPGQRWAMVVAQTLVVVVAVLSSAFSLDLLWSIEPFRALWILIILDIAMTALIPFFHWSSKAYFERERFSVLCSPDDDSQEAEPHRPRDERIRPYGQRYDASVRQ